jgi:hypothetical protein
MDVVPARKYLSHMTQLLFSRSLTLLTVAGALMAPVTAPLRADDLSKQVVRVTETKTVDAAPSGTIHLHSFRGQVNIEGWDQPRVEVTVVKSTAGFYRTSDPKQNDGAKQLLDSVKIQSELHGNETVIAADIPQHGRRKLNREVLVEYDIKAPRDSKIVIDSGDGGLYVTGMAGDIDATLKQGQLTLVLPENAGYTIDARARIGGVYWEGDGQEQRHHLFGHSFVSGQSSAAPQAAGQTVPITVTPSVGGVEQPSQRINVPVVQHKLHLNVCYGDIMITKEYARHTT